MLAATVKLVHSIIVSPNVARSNDFLFTFVSKGGVEVCMGLIRALALRGDFHHELKEFNACSLRASDSLAICWRRDA